MRFFVTMLIAALPVLVLAQDPPAQKKAGGNYKNLKVLTPDDMQAGAMRNYVGWLGLGSQGGCNYCHAAAPADKASDDNPKKLVARKMAAMVKEINTTLGATAQAKVTCYTCHRGKTQPDTVPPAGLPLP